MVERALGLCRNHVPLVVFPPCEPHTSESESARGDDDLVGIVVENMTWVIRFQTSPRDAVDVQYREVAAHTGDEPSG